MVDFVRQERKEMVVSGGGRFEDEKNARRVLRECKGKRIESYDYCFGRVVGKLISVGEQAYYIKEDDGQVSPFYYPDLLEARVFYSSD